MLASTLLVSLSIDIISTTREAKQQYFPIPENVAIYQKILPIYQNLLAQFQLEYVKFPSNFES